MWKDGKQHGSEIRRFENGVPANQGMWVNDKRQGVTTYWFNIGKKQKADVVETCYVRGKEYEWTTRNEEMAVNTVKQKIISTRV